MTVTEQRRIFPLLYGKNICIGERRERTILKKLRQWLQACDKLFQVSCFQWGHFPTFLDTISFLSRPDTLKSKIFSETSSGLTSKIKEIASVRNKKMLWEKNPTIYHRFLYNLFQDREKPIRTEGSLKM